MKQKQSFTSLQDISWQQQQQNHDIGVNGSVYIWKSKNAELQMCIFLAGVQLIIKIKGGHDAQKDIHSSPQFLGTGSG